MKPHKRVTIGDVFAVPIPGVGFAYARQGRDTSVCVYDVVTADLPSDLDLTTLKELFWTGFAWKGVRSGEWPIVLRQRFGKDEGWPPPMRELSLSKGMRVVWHRGKRYLKTIAETRGMPVSSIVSPKGLIDEILKHKSRLRIVDAASIDKTHRP